MELVKEVKKNGKTLKIYTDEDSDDPRSWDNACTMVCFHKRYDLGDKNHEYKWENYSSWQELEEAINEHERPLVIKPLYLLDHSGITISTSDFGDPWDSGMVGFAFISNKHVDETGLTINNDETFSDYRKRLSEVIDAEVETYDQYIRGNVYAFQLEDENGNTIDSCGGFYGNDWKANGLAESAGEEWLDVL